MSSVIRRDQELELVAGLCRELARLGLQVGLRDARPGVMVPNHSATLWITVDASGRFFECADAAIRHPTTDLTGAAALIHQHVTPTQEDT
jgi:hypothetical protein